MTHATGSQSYIALVKQTPATPRVIPGTPVMQKVNFVDDDLNRTNKTKKSAHIRDDRMNNGLTIQGFDIGGGYNFEHTFENSLFDELLAAFLWAEAWSTPQVDIDLEGGSFTVAGAVLDLTLATAAPTVVDGQKLYIKSTANSGENDGVYTLTETATDVYSVTPAPDANETFGAGVVANGSMIRNGKFYQPFFIERGHIDVSQYFKFVGMACNILTLAFMDQEDVTGAFQFVGLTSQLDQAIESGATYTPVTTNPVFSTALNMPAVSIDGVIQAGCLVKEMDLSVDNKVTPKTGLGVFGACQTNFHSLDVTGKITLFFEDETMYDRFLNGEKFSVDWDVIDANGHGYSYNLPSLQINEDSVNVSGVDDDVMDDATYSASVNVAGTHMIQIDKF